jgi:hypothetical protein
MLFFFTMLLIPHLVNCFGMPYNSLRLRMGKLTNLPLFGLGMLHVALNRIYQNFNGI